MARKVRLEDTAAIRDLVAANVESIEPGLQVIETGLRLGAATIDLVGLDANGSLVLMSVGGADQDTLLPLIDAYLWCVVNPENLHRLYPTADTATVHPPRIVVVAEQFEDTFVKSARQLTVAKVEAFELQHFDVKGQSVLCFEAVAIRDEPTPETDATPTAETADEPLPAVEQTTEVVLDPPAGEAVVVGEPAPGEWDTFLSNLGVEPTTAAFAPPASVPTVVPTPPPAPVVPAPAPIVTAPAPVAKAPAPIAKAPVAKPAPSVAPAISKPVAPAPKSAAPVSSPKPMAAAPAVSAASAPAPAAPVTKPPVVAKSSEPTPAEPKAAPAKPAPAWAAGALAAVAPVTPKAAEPRPVESAPAAPKPVAFTAAPAAPKPVAFTPAPAARKPVTFTAAPAAPKPVVPTAAPAASAPVAATPQSGARPATMPIGFGAPPVKPAVANGTKPTPPPAPAAGKQPRLFASAVKGAPGAAPPLKIVRTADEMASATSQPAAPPAQNAQAAGIDANFVAAPDKPAAQTNGARTKADAHTVVHVDGDEPAMMAAPAHPALESLKFPKDGLSRQWLEFLNQLAAKK